MSSLASKECIPCKGGVPPLTSAQVSVLLPELDGWGVENNHHLHRTFTFPDFIKALAFVNHVGELAEQQGHHPDIYLSWGMVKITIWTHKIDGLTESDFVMAAKIDQIPR